MRAGTVRVVAFTQGILAGIGRPMKPSSRWRSEAGSTTLELALSAGVLLVLLSLAIAGGRIALAGQNVSAAAAEAAREASLARSGPVARTRAGTVARHFLTEVGLQCTNVTVRIDTAQFARAVGRDAEVLVDVACRVPLSDLAVPGLPGSRTVHARATSPLDTYRIRE